MTVDEAMDDQEHADRRGAEPAAGEDPLLGARRGRDQERHRRLQGEAARRKAAMAPRRRRRKRGAVAARGAKRGHRGHATRAVARDQEAQPAQRDGKPAQGAARRHARRRLLRVLLRVRVVGQPSRAPRGQGPRRSRTARCASSSTRRASSTSTARRSTSSTTHDGPRVQVREPEREGRLRLRRERPVLGRDSDSFVRASAMSRDPFDVAAAVARAAYDARRRRRRSSERLPRRCRSELASRIASPRRAARAAQAVAARRPSSTRPGASLQAIRCGAPSTCSSSTGVDVGDEKSQRDGASAAVPPALLMEMMELREELAEARAAGDARKVAAHGRRRCAARAAAAMQTIARRARRAATREARRGGARRWSRCATTQRFLDEVDAHEERRASEAAMAEAFLQIAEPGESHDQSVPAGRARSASISAPPTRSSRSCDDGAAGRACPTSDGERAPAVGGALRAPTGRSSSARRRCDARRRASARHHRVGQALHGARARRRRRRRARLTPYEFAPPRRRGRWCASRSRARASVTPDRGLGRDPARAQGARRGRARRRRSTAR